MEQAVWFITKLPALLDSVQKLRSQFAGGGCDSSNRGHRSECEAQDSRRDERMVKLEAQVASLQAHFESRRPDTPSTASSESPQEAPADLLEQLEEQILNLMMEYTKAEEEKVELQKKVDELVPENFVLQAKCDKLEEEVRAACLDKQTLEDEKLAWELHQSQERDKFDPNGVRERAVFEEQIQRLQQEVQSLNDQKKTIATILAHAFEEHQIDQERLELHGDVASKVRTIAQKWGESLANVANLRAQVGRLTQEKIKLEEEQAKTNNKNFELEEEKYALDREAKKAEAERNAAQRSKKALEETVKKLEAKVADLEQTKECLKDFVDDLLKRESSSV